MNKKVAILIPTYKRPHRIKEVIDNIRSVTNMDLAEIVFIVEEDDYEVVNECKKYEEKIIFNKRIKSYAGAMNTAVRELDNEFFFAASDDFLFHKNWLEPLLTYSVAYSVVGANDLGNPMVAAGQLAVSYLIKKSYLSRAVLDSPGDMVFEGYLHNFTDTEMTQTAIFQNEYGYCPESIVEHMHPDFGKSERDETYNKQNGTWEHDSNLYAQRSVMWSKKF
jgi:glycosyltransferase involved in cell wall biosynthesis